MGKKKQSKSYDRVLFQLISCLVLGILSVVCVIPFWLVISGSLSKQQSIQLKDIG